MINPKDFELKEVHSKTVAEYINKGKLKPTELNKLLDPMPTDDEIKSLMSSLLSTGGTNRENPIVIYNWSIVDGKSRFDALRKIKAKKYYFNIIPKESYTMEEVNKYTQRTMVRRDKTKTQKAISAYRFGVNEPTLTLAELSDMFGAGASTISKARNIAVLGYTDVLDLLFDGGSYKYETTNEHTGETKMKQTTSIAVVNNILRGLGHKEDESTSTKSMSESYRTDTSNKTVADIILSIHALSDEEKKLVRNVL